MHPEPLPVTGEIPSAGPSRAASSQDFDEFIYLISHDVRSSVRALIELPQWIAEDLEEAGFPVAGSVAASIEMMNRHAGRLDRMLVDLLTFSRIGRMQEVRENDLVAALDHVLDAVQVPSGFEVLRNLECKSVTMGERDLLTLLDALVQNAIKHHDKPTGRVAISTFSDDTDVVIRVVDDGPGVAEELREKAFGAMRTLKPRDEVEGSGMGLANVQKIAGVYGGSVRLADSPNGRGTLVEVRMRNAQACPSS